MSNPFIRSQLVLGEEGLKKIANARVAVFGVGGVGGYVIEALARCGIGEIDIIDNDTVAESNINRQIIATHSTIGEYKVDVMEKRIKDISPDTIVHKYTTFYLPENRDTFDFTNYDYIVDAIDTVTAKIDMICYAKSVKTPIISCMGCGNRMDPAQLELTDIYKTKNDPLAKVMRHELKKRHINKCKVVCSKELPVKTHYTEQDSKKRSVPGSTAFVPSAAGLICASYIVRELIK